MILSRQVSVGAGAGGMPALHDPEVGARNVMEMGSRRDVKNRSLRRTAL
ncbi:hypothetical protein [Roseovarius pelagicus]|uniref:Uncharacterized protein n=1 Tax=Roseovarius pelagicus TaxID=2980108 RepID=A0ABY6DEL4_9RHOB|nr:hypothetical protein [Roseovarius pelagicus]UXX84596.1 hypothetical protein N7U68_08150 [Roseovarius pelagicus]